MRTSSQVVIGSLRNPRLPAHRIFGVGSLNLNGMKLSDLMTDTRVHMIPETKQPCVGKKRRKQILPPPPAELTPEFPELPDAIHPVLEVLDECATYEIDVLAAQEIPSTKSIQKHVSRQRPEFVCSLNNGHDRHRAVHNTTPSSAIISHKTSSGQLINRRKERDGRVTSQTFSLGKSSPHRRFTRLTIISVYAPQNTAFRALFFAQLTAKVEDLRLRKHLVIIAGDLQIAPTKLDRSSGKTSPQESELFDSFIKATGLLDAFRELHPTKTEAWSFHQQGFLSASRIDHILIDPHLRPALLSAGILKHKSFTHSNTADHRLVVVHFDREKIFGPPPPRRQRQPKPPTPAYDGLDSSAWRKEEKERAQELTELSKQKFKAFAATL